MIIMLICSTDHPRHSTIPEGLLHFFRGHAQGMSSPSINQPRTPLTGTCGPGLIHVEQDMVYNCQLLVAGHTQGGVAQ